MKSNKPNYCPCENESLTPCPACGATVSGNDPVRGVCQAKHGVKPDAPSVIVVLINRRTGEII